MLARHVFPAVIVAALVAAAPIAAQTGPGASPDEGFAPALYSTARAELDKVAADLKKIEADLRGHDQTIAKGEGLVAKAREKNNTEVETVAREYLQKARDAKARDESTRARLQGALRAAQSQLAKAEAAMAAWVRPYRALIDERLKDAGTVYGAILDSVTSRRDPPAPPRKSWADLKSGDVLLVAPAEGYAPGDLASKGLMYVDKVTSWEWGAGSSRASHSLIYLKTVDGQKLFLDDQLGEGPRIKTEEMILNEYKGRAMDVAHPIAKIDADTLWTAASALEVKNLKHIEQSPLGLSNYNLYGDDHMVCSEAARWALIRAWPEVAVKDYQDTIQDTASPFKKALGVYFGPANFYADRQHFIVSALETPR